MDGGGAAAAIYFGARPPDSLGRVSRMSRVSRESSESSESSPTTSSFIYFLYKNLPLTTIVSIDPAPANRPNRRVECGKQLHSDRGGRQERHDLSVPAVWEVGSIGRGRSCSFSVWVVGAT